MKLLVLAGLIAGGAQDAANAERSPQIVPGKLATLMYQLDDNTFHVGCRPTNSAAKLTEAVFDECDAMALEALEPYSKRLPKTFDERHPFGKAGKAMRELIGRTSNASLERSIELKPARRVRGR